jgi:adenylate cyclase
MSTIGVRCAVEVQRAMANRNANLPQGRRIELRIGINVGDIVSDEGDIFGDGVNVAARLEGLSELESSSDYGTAD